MSEIADFLRARYAEQRALALAASPGPWQPNDEHDEVIAVDGITVAEGFALSGQQLRATVDHIAAHDPAAVLADLDAKLAIVDWHGAREATGFDADGWEHTGNACQTCLAGDDWPCRTLRLLARPFAKHPDHKGEEWAP
ncbi:DUF6221 family protein [Streptomyces anthocyanicus]|uniref:DUF6221 family protein n=1 Tax=Streptomyces anthocyanicus TaxID=68174 RepID=UPI0038693722|nr:DUF6221 family protein [Streptomyces anthocyanicus]